MRYVKITFLFLVVLLGGCWDRTEIEEVALVIAIGLDKGENGSVKVTYQIANPVVGSNLATGDVTASEVITLHSADIVSARDLANISISRTLSFAHAKSIIVSQELARSDEFLPIITAAIRDRHVRRELHFIVSKESAEQFIREENLTLEVRPHKFYDLMARRWEETGLTPYSTLSRFYSITENDGDLFLAISATRGTEETKITADNDDYYAGEVEKRSSNQIQMIGSVVFKKGKIIGELTGEETRLALWLRPEERADMMLITLEDPEDPNKKVTVKVFKREKTNITIDTSHDVPKIHVSVPLLVEVLGIHSNTNYVTNLDQQSRLKEAFQAELEEKVNQLISYTQNDLKGDPFLWSLRARRNFVTVDQFKDYQWMEKYEQADIHVSFDLTFKDFGQKLHPSKVEKIKGEG
ncbi:Ger(x)C family spore germination protein [Anaerobacillus alkaliphilus]|uniref:Ger(x)C family spore germination protein n=1 Tax=Anaerobacillus alkaliphilus TaxID=1548597 RepID=UPI0013761C3A|nr:Ger(x)C family spore germination protein [Anaerobacillus alkaliphilus]